MTSSDKLPVKTTPLARASSIFPMHPHTAKRTASDTEEPERQELHKRPKYPAHEEDLWTEAEHQDLDSHIFTRIPDIFKGDITRVVDFATVHLVYQIQMKTGLGLNKIEKLLQEDEALKKMLIEASQGGSFRDIRNLAIFRQSSVDQPTYLSTEAPVDDQQKATVLSWSSDFVGTAHKTLWNTVSSYITISHACYKDEQQRLKPGAPYSNFGFIVNSSGTGKSRMVIEMGREFCLVIPICLRKDNGSGYPPADRLIRDFLLEPKDEFEAGSYARAFLDALFEVTHKYLLDLPSDAPTRRRNFTNFMNEATHQNAFKEHSSYRIHFSKDVVETAKKLLNSEAGTNAKPKYMKKIRSTEATSGTNDFFKFLDMEHVVIALDEAHVLQSQDHPGWSMLTELRRAFRHVMLFNTFMLIMTTTGKFKLLSPNLEKERSERVATQRLSLYLPIPETSWAQLALPIDHNNPLLLSYFTSARYVSHSARPVFATRFDSGTPSVQRDLLEFARVKLVGQSGQGQSPDLKSELLQVAGVMACLSVRFGIVFCPTNDAQAELERSLVENHMRFCIAANERMQMITTAPSEPLLAEAAFLHLHYHLGNISYLAILAKNLAKWAVHCGDRGELVANAILMGARDRAVKEQWDRLSSQISRSEIPWEPYSRSIISMDAFMKKLLPATYHTELDHMVPSVGEGPKFSETFKNVKIWCNHFIQVQDFEVINVKYLCALLTNGIGVLCAPNQEGIDSILIGLDGEEVIPEKIVVILVQAKNVSSMASFSSTILAKMDPIKLNIAGKSQLKTIRMVFSMADTRPSVRLVSPRARRSKCVQPKMNSDAIKPDPFIAYDFWFSGVSPLTFGCVEERDVCHYESILAQSSSIYTVADPIPGLSEWQITNLEAIRNTVTQLASERSALRRASALMQRALPDHFTKPWKAILFPDEEGVKTQGTRTSEDMEEEEDKEDEGEEGEEEVADM